MADGMNKAILIGNLGIDPELRFTRAGKPVLNLRLATNQTWKDHDGNRQERVEWHTVVVWGKRGEALEKILYKGMRIGIEGRIRNDKYEKDGVDRFKTEIIASDVYLLDGRRNGRPSLGATGTDGGGPTFSSSQPEGPLADADIPF